MHFFQMATKSALNHLLCTEIENLLFTLTCLPAQVTYPGDSLHWTGTFFVFGSDFSICPKQALQSFLLVTIFMWPYTSQHQQLAGVVKELISDHRDPLPCQEDCQCRRCLRLCSLSLLGSACSFLRKKSCNSFNKVGVCNSACSFLKWWLCAVGWFIAQRIRRVNEDQLTGTLILQYLTMCL